jgi:pyruvate/2-oxoglutarate dehydrogenase complex dihydrolipoamide acyltransferase (E2) component
MPVEIVVPKWGLSMQEGLIGQWFKREGDRVEAGEPLLQIETEKITNVVEAPASGVLARVLYPEGSSVPVSEVIALITAPGEPVPEVAAPTAAPPASGVAAPPVPAPAGQAPAAQAVVRAMPAARRLARERGLDLASVAATGPDGVVTREDVERALAPPDAPAGPAGLLLQRRPPAGRAALHARRPGAR